MPAMATARAGTRGSVPRSAAQLPESARHGSASGRRRRAARCALLAVLATGGGSFAATGPWSEMPEARVRLVSRWAVAPAGGDAGLGLEFALAPGWHVYWKNSGDAGFPPRLELAPAPGLGAATLRFPAPQRFELPGDLVSIGYEEAVIYPIDAALDPAAAGELALAARLDYLVCAEKCIPYLAELALTLSIGGAAEDAEMAPAVDRWRSRLPRRATEVEPPVAVTIRWLPGDYPWSTLELGLSAAGLRTPDPDLFFAPQDWVELARPRFVASADGPVFRVPLRSLDETRPLPDPLPLEWTATGLEIASASLALEGTAALSRPAPEARNRFVWIGAVILLTVVIYLARRRRQRPGGNPA